MSTFFDQPSPLRRTGIAAAIAISLALHALVLFGYRLSAPPTAATPAREMTVWLRPLTPPKPPAPVARREPSPPPKRERLSPPAPAVAAQPPAQPKPAESQAITLPPAPDPLHPEQQPKQFDMNAALQTARKVANEKDPARANLPVAQLDDHPLYPEDKQTKLQKGIASAKKYDCKDAGAGAGLLAPLIWLTDKHCKF